MRTLLLYSFCLYLSFNLQAQNLEKRLSARKSAIVVSLNAQNYKPKGKFQTLLELDYFKRLDKTFKEKYAKNYELTSAIYRNPEEIGINAYPRAYAFINTLDSNVVFLGLLFNLANPEKFEKWAKIFFQNTDVIQLKNLDENLYLQDDYVVAWNKQCALIASITINERKIYEAISYDDPDYDSKLEEKERQIKELKAKLLKSESSSILQANQSEALSENSNFQLFIQKSHDLGIWLNYEQFTQALVNVVKEIPEVRLGYMQALATRVKSFYKNYYDHILFNTQKGATTLTYETYLSDKMYQLIGNAFSKRINPAFYNYIEGKNLLGLYAVSGDLKMIGNALIELYKNFGEDLTKEGKIISAAVDALTVILDENAILEIFKGDAIIAFTDVKDMETEYTDYEYEGETYIGAVKKKRIEKVPAYVAILSVGNQGYLQKFIHLFNVLGGFELQPQGNFYLIKDVGKVQNYLAVENSMLIITNDFELISNLKNFKPSKSVEVRLQKLMQENPMMVYVNIPKVVETILMHKTNLSTDEKKDLQEMKKEIAEFLMVGPLLKGNTFYSEGILQVSNAKTNSLPIMVRFFNRFFKDRSGMYETEDILNTKKRKN